MLGSAHSAEARSIEAVDAPEAFEKLEKLRYVIASMPSVLVAFSGGVDSSFLVRVAHDALEEKAGAITATSPTYPEHEFKQACAFAASLGIRHFVVDSNELLIPNFSDNTEKRCYYCKTELFKLALVKAREEGYAVVCDGSNMDDLGDYRPGSVAAGELGIRSPLQEAGLTKPEIRLLSKDMGLSMWDKPSFACLSSRFPYGTEITAQRLGRVVSAEEVLRALGFRQFRVRYSDDTARIEAGADELGRFLDEKTRAHIVDGLKAVGFTYVTLDLQGYRAGSMNETLKKKNGDNQVI